MPFPCSTDMSPAVRPLVYHGEIMPLTAEPRHQVDDDPESAVSVDYGGSDARARLAASASLLELSPAHSEYARRLEAIVTREAPLEHVLGWDRAKMPPLPVLRSMVNEGIFVSGVPIPDAVLA